MTVEQAAALPTPELLAAALADPADQVLQGEVRVRDLREILAVR